MYRCLPYKTYGVRKRNLGLASINRQIQKYVANHNKDGPKTKVKMKTFLTALSSVLYSMVYFPPYVLCGKHLYPVIVLYATVPGYISYSRSVKLVLL